MSNEIGSKYDIVDPQDESEYELAFHASKKLGEEARAKWPEHMREQEEETIQEAVDRHFKFAEENNLSTPDYKSYNDRMKEQEQ